MPTFREVLPWAGAVIIILIVACFLIWLNQPPENSLPEVYGVM